MKTYLAHKNQIRGFKDVSDTVKAVEKIAASFVHFLKRETANLNAYEAEIEKMLARLSLFYQEKDHPLLQEKSVGKRAIVILTGNKGLVGGLWHNVINAFLENVEQYQIVVVFGERGKNYLKEENVAFIKPLAKTKADNSESKNALENKKHGQGKQTRQPYNFLNTSQRREIKVAVDYAFDGFGRGIFSRVDVLYPQFVSLAEQRPCFVSFLPFKFAARAFRSSSNTARAQNKNNFFIAQRIALTTELTDQII